MPDRSRPSSRWKTAIRCCAAARTNSTKASGPFSKSESLSISSDNKKDPERIIFRETQYGWDCGRGAEKARLSQDRVARTRHRGRTAVRRRHRAEVPHSAERLRDTHPGVAGEMG